jgi:hypothetical protein
MASSGVSHGPPSLLGNTVRRSFTVGKLNLAIGTIISLFYGVILSVVPGDTFSTLLPLLLPIMGTVGGIGAMLVFTNDRTKGVFEYLIAYGVPPRQIFLNVLGAAMVLLSVVDGATLAVSVALRLGLGYGVPLVFGERILIYSLPMSYGATALCTSAGMYWTSLSTPRQGMNSPLGLLPLLGVAPGALTLIAAEVAGPALAPYVALGAVLLVVILALILFALESRLMPRERLLSPA